MLSELVQVTNSMATLIRVYMMYYVHPKHLSWVHLFGNVICWLPKFRWAWSLRSFSSCLCGQRNSVKVRKGILSSVLACISAAEVHGAWGPSLSASAESSAESKREGVQAQFLLGFWLQTWISKELFQPALRDERVSSWQVLQPCLLTSPVTF